MTKQIHFKERQQINFLLKHQVSVREIARELGRSPSSISEEIKRNKEVSGYHASWCSSKK
jgi:IS30 family transposase